MPKELPPAEDIKKLALPHPHHPLAAFQNILEGFFEVARVPGVGHVAAGAGVGHQKMDLAVGIVRNDAAEQAQIGGIHAHDAVEAGIVGPCDLTGALARIERNAVLGEAAPGRRIDGIADFFRRHGRGLDVIAVFHAAGAHQGLEDELGHGAPANISVANEEYTHAIHNHWQRYGILK